MKRYRFGIFILIAGLLAIFATGGVQAQETVVVDSQGQPVIVTAVPAPKEVIVVPQGFVNCFMVPAGWNYNNVWVAEHKVCQYSPANGAAAQGVAWVESYWACTKYINANDPKQGECTNWQWQPAHWVKTLEVY